VDSAAAAVVIAADSAAAAAVVIAADSAAVVAEVATNQADC
jgi:hypothetical protein